MGINVSDSVFNCINKYGFNIIKYAIDMFVPLSIVIF